MKTRLAFLVISLVAAAVVDCGRSESRSAPASDSAAAAGSLEGARHADTTSGTTAMQMPGIMNAASMDSMEAHMRMMDGMSGEQIKAMLATHRQMLANMVSQMNQEMRSMNMSADPQWTATADSLRQDLVHMPDMSAAELKRAMPAHHARVTRLLQLHRAMQKK